MSVIEPPGRATGEGRDEAATAPLVELLDAAQAPLLARPFYGGAPTSPIIGSLAHVPELLEVALPFVSGALGAGGLDARTKELAVLRTSALLECRYCVDTHTVVALDCGITPEEVRTLRGELELDATFTDARERAMLAWVDAVATGRGPVAADVRARAGAALSDFELVELTVTITATLMLNRYCTALGLPTPAGTLARLAEADFA